MGSQLCNHWIPGARNMLRNMRRQCVVCQRLFGKPRNQKMADLPVERCTPGPTAFIHVGVDLFGPFYVVRGRSTVERYGCVFTFLYPGHPYRFFSRRGQPKTVRPDRGTNLVGACSELASEVKRQDKIILLVRPVEWTLNGLSILPWHLTMEEFGKE